MNTKRQCPRSLRRTFHCSWFITRGRIRSLLPFEGRYFGNEPTYFFSPWVVAILMLHRVENKHDNNPILTVVRSHCNARQLGCEKWYVSSPSIKLLLMWSWVSFYFLQGSVGPIHWQLFLFLALTRNNVNTAGDESFCWWQTTSFTSSHLFVQSCRIRSVLQLPALLHISPVCHWPSANEPWKTLVLFWTRHLWLFCLWVG